MPYIYSDTFGVASTFVILFLKVMCVIIEVRIDQLSWKCLDLEIVYQPKNNNLDYTAENSL